MQEFKRRHEINAARETAAAKIAKALGLEMPTAMLLAMRGITNPDEAREFLSPQAEGLNDPFAFEAMRDAVARILFAIGEKEKITVYSDYDADGTTAASCLYLYLKERGANVSIYTPHRHREGYGMNTEAVKSIAKGGTKLVITVDCGITNTEEVRAAKELGMGVIITDHHECPEILPEADYIINPKLPGCAYPFRHLCGAGVALKLVEALGGRDAAMQYIDLAALGTIADIVPLLGENRVISALGIQKMRKNPCTGIKLLAEAAGMELKTLEARSVAFGLAPRINAASRMDDGRLAVSLLTAEREDEASEGIAKTLCEHNKTRQQIEEGILTEAAARLKTLDLVNERAVILEDETWNTGVIGIVASQLLDRLYRPVILFGAEGENYVGSARSTDEINIFEALSKFAHLFVRFGGHFHAAGLTIKKENLSLLKQGLNEYLKDNYPEDVRIRQSVYDLDIALPDINTKLAGELERLRPFGQDNPQALFRIAGADIHSHSYVGKASRDHLRLSLEEAGTTVNAICFNHVNRYCYLSGENEYLAELSINDYDNKPQLMIQAIKPRITKTTLEAYIAAFKKPRAQAFIEEITALPGSTDADFEECLARDLEKSRFGTAVLFNTREGYMRALHMPCIQEALKSGRMEIPCEIGAEVCGGNALTGYFVPEPVRYENIYCIGAFLPDGAKPKRCLDEPLLAAYRRRAKEYFVERAELLDIYKSMREHLSDGSLKTSEDAERVSAVLGLSYNRLLFACNVFFELGLIDALNNDKIKFKTVRQNDKKDLADSKTYCIFRDFTASAKFLEAVLK